MPNDAVIQLLELSDMYLCKDAREYAIQHLQRQRFSLEPPQLISLALKYHIKALLPHAFERLVSTRINDISDAERHVIGSVVWNTMIKVKERLDVHRRIVACEAPPTMVHAGTCSMQNKCEEDWKQLWWNGMGRFLLDGRNPQPYKDAVERFEKLDTGGVNYGCWKAMLLVIQGHTAFSHEQKLISRTADNLVKCLIVEPNFGTIGHTD